MKTSIVRVMKVALTILVGLGISLESLSVSNAAEKPKPGGTFVVGLHADPDTLNPVITTETQTRMVA